MPGLNIKIMSWLIFIFVHIYSPSIRGPRRLCIKHGYIKPIMTRARQHPGQPIDRR